MNEYKKKFQAFISSHLNAEQQKAVIPAHGSFLVIAGAGSGKTRVITSRITNLILEHNVEPSSIIALTFTNKAAGEMQHRIEQALPHTQTKPIIATFHSYCLRLLKTNRHLLKSETFSIIDSQDQYKLVQNIIKDHGVANIFNTKQLLSSFSSFKMSETLKLNDIAVNVPDHHLQKFMELYNAYESQKRVSNYFDFDDLLYKTYHLFDTNPTFQIQHQNRHRHVLVDEYQDTNTIQHELLKKMTLINGNVTVDSVCAVGDEDQSIYSWRGATVKNILEFDQEFPNTTIIKLEQNYRSTQRILDIANHVITHNRQRKHKKLWSNETENHTPLQLECLSDLQEAYSITNSIKVLNKTQPLSSIAILYRTHYQSRVIEEALIKDSIPYKMIGGIQFYERKEIKDLIAYMRLVVNPFDKMSFIRIINCPLRGLGAKFEEQFLELWDKNPFSNFLEIARKLIDDNLIAPKQVATVSSFIKFFNDLSDQTSPVEALEQFIKQTEYIVYLQDSFDKAEAQTKKENVFEFIRAAQYAEQIHKATLASFLEDITLMQEHMTGENSADSVQMMTLHSAKGLEFDTVLLSGIEDGIIPSNQSIEHGNIEEERRLFYVGLTRAKKKLLLTYSKYRNTFGQMTVQRASRFLDEIPSHLIQQEEAKHWSKSQFSTFFTQWVTQSTVATNKIVKPIKPMIQQYASMPKANFNSIVNPTIVTTSKSSSLSFGKFKRLQSVKHPKFGLGIIQLIEPKGDKTFVTVHFTSYGKKKIESSFLEII